MCHLTWLYSRKYGTVWYHPASSKLWDLTTLSFVNFQGKLTGTSCDLFACEASLFGLLCAWRRVRILRQQQLNKNVEAYVDDVVVKTRNSNTLIADLEETFASLREYRWKLTQTSASSAYRRANYSASSSATAASKPIPRISPSSPA
jgi:hypothetical protein